jgi:hypothetical protein
MNKVRIKEAAVAIKNRIKSATKHFSGNKTVAPVGQGKKLDAQQPVVGKGEDVGKNR